MKQNIAQINYQGNKCNRGAKYKLLEDKKLITYIEDDTLRKILNYKTLIEVFSEYMA